MRLSELAVKARSLLQGRATAYKLTFNGQAADAVLRDLARFCRAHKSTYHPDPHLSAKLDGRREVWLRIANHLNLSEEQLWDLYKRIDQ